MGRTHPSSCWRNCGTCTANHIHIFDALNEVFQQDISQDPTVVLLGVIPASQKVRDKKLLLHILLKAALKCIAIRCTLFV